jgi:exosortase
MGAPATEREPVGDQFSSDRSTWILFGVVGALLLISYAPVLRDLIRDWIHDENVGHGFFVPLVAGYIAWQKQDELREAKWTRSWFGLVLVVGAAIQLYVATLGAELFLARSAFVISLTGAVLWLGGMQVLRILSFPLFLLWFMIPIPAIIYNQITLPLQFLASEVAEKVLGLLGIPVLREGNILELPSQRLSVVEACSGIRSLLSLSFLSLVYGYFFETRNWLRAILFLATIPIAIATNAGRVTATGLLSEIDPDLTTGATHLAEGWVVFVAALALLLLTHRLALGLLRVLGPRGGASLGDQS